MRAAWLMATLALVALPVVALAGEGDARPPPTKEDQAQAAKKFKEGEKAYASHEYAAAAQAFEEAYALAPHPDALLNAIDARRKAGDLRVAAQHCQRLLSEFPDGKPASDARQRLGDLTPKLGRIEVVAKGGEAKQIFIDQYPAKLGEVFVDPGDHVVVATFDGKEVERRVSVVAGARATVLLEPPSNQVAGAGGGTTEGPKGSGQPKGEAGTEAPREERPIPLPVFFVGLGLTFVTGSLTVWSGLDTNSAREDFDANPTREAYDDGLSAEVRTNVFIGLTAAFGAATGVIAIFTEWSTGDSTEAALRVGPGSIGLEGSF